MVTKEKDVSLTIDGVLMKVPEGTLVVDAARSIGVQIPTLCHLSGCEGRSSCMVCVVKDARSGKLFPSCSVRATGGMVIETEEDDVVAARRTAVELLLSDHSGECEAPCEISCPSGIRIPEILSALQNEEPKRAYEILSESCVSDELPCFECKGVCGRACRRGRFDESIDIQRVIIDLDAKAKADGFDSGDPKEIKKMKYRHRLGDGGKAYYDALLANCERVQGPNFTLIDRLQKKQDDMVDEARRCMLCGCAVSRDCKLRLYADQFGAKSRSYEGSKKMDSGFDFSLDQILREPGKCIQCGICVRLTEDVDDGAKMGFEGRGFNMTVRPIVSEGRRRLPDECIEKCPTGALVWRDRSKR